jgi:hypothetical protein
MALACPAKRGGGGGDFVILFGIGIGIGIGIAIDIGSSHVRHPFRPRQRLRCRCRMRHTGVGYLVALGTPERLSLPGSHGQRPSVYHALIDTINIISRKRYLVTDRSNVHPLWQRLDGANLDNGLLDLCVANIL